MPSYETNAPQGYCGDWKRGAPLGRPTAKPDLRTPAQLEEEAAQNDAFALEAERDKERRHTPDSYKAIYWETAAASFRRKAGELRAMIPAAAARVVAPPVKVTLQRVRLDSGGYDPQGAYFGIGAPLYWAATDDGELDATFRADDRADAKAHVRELLPNARFYN